MKKLLLVLLLLPALMSAQTKVYRSLEIAVSDDVTMAANATIVVNPADSLVKINFIIKENFSTTYKILEKSTNAQTYKITNDVETYTMYIISTKRIGEPLSLKYQWLIQIVSENDVLTYYCNEVAQ